MTSKILSLYGRALCSLAVTLALGAMSIGTQTMTVGAASASSANRTLRVVSTNASPGGEAVVSVEFDSLGNEVAMSFSVDFDPAKLTTPVITLGSGAPAGTAITINQNQVESGHIGFLLDSMSSFAVSPPARQAVSIKFKVAPNAPGGQTLVTLGSSPSPRSTSDIFGNLVPSNYEDGSVNIAGPQPIELSGQVITSSGSGLRNATVTLTDSDNNRRSVPTSSMGYYTFTDVVPGKTYTVTVASRLYRFLPVTVQVEGTISNLNLLGMQ